MTPRPKRSNTSEFQQACVRLHREGLSNSEIATRLKAHRSTIARALREQGIQAQPRGPKAKPTKSKRVSKPVLSQCQVERGLEQPMVSRCRCGWSAEGPACEVLAAFRRHACQAAA